MSRSAAPAGSVESHRISLGLLAIAGVLLGHAVGYLVAYPDDVERALASAGHGYLGPLSVVLAPAGLVALLAIAVRTVRSLGAAPTWHRLAGLQVGVFLAQEVLERIPGPGVPVDVLTERAVWVGLAAQLLVAWLSLRLVALTAGVVRAIAHGAPRRVGAPTLLVAPPTSVVVPGRKTTDRLPRRRGPPVLVGTPIPV